MNLRQKRDMTPVAAHFGAGVILLLLYFFASTASAAGMLDTIVGNAASATGGWMNESLKYAKSLFFGLAAIEFVWAAVQLTLQRGELSEFAVGLLMKIIAISFFSMVLAKAPEWIPLVMQSFKDAGASVGSGNYGANGSVNMTNCSAGVLSASAVVDQGLCVADKLVTTSMYYIGNRDGKADFIDIITNFLPVIVIGLSSIITIIGFVILAIQLAITLIESYIVIGGGILMLGFLGSRWTMNYAERFFGYAVSIGVKLFTLYLIIGLGDSFVTSLVNYIANEVANNGTVTTTTLLGTAGGSVIYGAIGYLVPGLAGSMLNGSPSLSMSNISQTGKGVASAPVGAALTGGAAGARTLGAGAGAIAWLASRFGGSRGGSIGGVPPGGGGGGGSIIGSFGGPIGGPGIPAPGGRPTGGAPGGPGSVGGASGPALPPTRPAGTPVGGTPVGGAPVGGTPVGGTPVGGAPGFQDPRSMTPRSMDPDRREREVMLGAASAEGGQGQETGQTRKPGRLERFSRLMNNAAREMQYASYRHQVPMGHDGNTGGAPGIRLNI